MLGRPVAFLIAILTGLWLAMLLLGGPASRLDLLVAGAFHRPAWVPAARLLTRLGDWDMLLPLSAAAAVLIALTVSRRNALLYVLLIGSGRLLVELEKAAIGRHRPAADGRLTAVTTLSFPSGHAAYSMMAWLGLVLLGVPRGRLRIPALAAALAIAILVGLTRLVLAVHWPSDVIGGWAFGAAWTLLLLRLAEGTSTQMRDRSRRESGVDDNPNDRGEATDVTAS